MANMSANQGAIIVTGASRGIGAAVARLAGARGYAVAVNFRNDRAAADAVVADIVALGCRATAIHADVADEDQVVRLFAGAERELGRIEGLVNNAGITGRICRLEELDAASLAEVLTVNVAGSILCAREAVRRMSRRHGGTGGSIVNISSIAARLGGSGEYVHYAASKGAIDAFTIGLAREVAGDGIRVNAIAPGLIDTEIHASSPGRLERLTPLVPMQRVGTAQEVAEGVLWLLSPEASYTTGAILEIGGGR
jgi:NAD(P)-dependent dehydrogenase (short-subunit alcohol dehydrogenase family)